MFNNLFIYSIIYPITTFTKFLIYVNNVCFC